MFELPKLDYAYNALEPWIDEQTMIIHHTKHHQAYTDNFNKAIAGTPFESKAVEDILGNLNAVPEGIRNAVRNHGGGFYNHALFWKMMGPGKGGQPSGNLGDALNGKFGSFDKFVEQFSASAMGRFGSGWAWLALNGSNLEIVSTANQDTPLSEGKLPLLAIDMWEHSFYLKWQNRKAEYVKAWWNVVNWDFAEGQFNKK
jgi:Fe-Mn family superoxide dismutase